MPFLGEICALLTAVCWTLSSSAFAVASRAVGPLPANQFRLVVALPALFVLAFVVTGGIWPSLTTSQLCLLIASGLIGLVLGDIGYFYALAKIGPRLCSVIMACWPACTVGLEACLGHLPNRTMLLGILCTMCGVVLVLLRSRDGALWNASTSAAQWWLGIAAAFLGALGQATGFVLAGYGMQATANTAPIDPLLVTVVRMTTAVAGLQVVAMLQQQPFAMRSVWGDRVALRAALVGAVFGPIGGVWLSMLARQHASDAGVAAALMATTPVFMMPVALVLYRARIGALGMVGTVLAVAGVAVCFLAQGSGSR